MSEVQENRLARLVSDLPEVYQPVYGHNALSEDVSRTCVDRLSVICRIYDAFQAQLDRPLRVLDLGCAQGFFSLSLAERGAEVVGVDCLDKNIAVCNALAEEYPNYNLRFEVGQVEELAETLTENSYDLVLCLSVLHHIVHEKGSETAQKIVDSLAQSAGLLLVETALREEPLYWAEAQPEDPRQLFQNCAFVQETACHETHLSSVSRPLFSVSNQCWVVGGLCGEIESWTDDPHAFAQGTHQGGRRYFFSSDAVVKQYRFEHSRGWLNRKEFEREISFFENVPKGISAPAFLSSADCGNEGWVVLERVPGRLLLQLLEESADIDRMSVLHSVLEQLAALEDAGLYHNDVRVWNILVETDGSTTLLDAGSISTDQADCVWPENIFLSFFIFVHELLTGEVAPVESLRLCHMTPYSLPQPCRDWSASIWRYPIEEWSFSLMLKLLDSSGGAEIRLDQPLGAWIGAIELALDRQAEFVHYLWTRLESEGVATGDLLNAVERMEKAAKAIEEKTCRIVADEEVLRTRAEMLAQNASDRAALSEARAQQNTRLALNEAARAGQAEKRSVELEGKLSDEYERSAEIEKQLHEQAEVLLRIELKKENLTKAVKHLTKLEKTLRAELGDARVKVDELNQSSHYWWTVAERLTGELRETEERGQWLENEWNAAKAEVDELNRLSHHWWTVADTLRQQLEEVHGSRCVRWTAPLRWVSMQLRRLLNEGLFARLKALVKKILRPFARKTGQFILRHPRLKERVRFFLCRHSRLNARVRRFAEGNGFLFRTEVPASSQAEAAFSGKFSGMLVASSGLCDPESWGCWSNGKVVSFEFEEALPERFSLLITAKAFGPNAGREFFACVGDSRVEFVLEHEPARCAVELVNPSRSHVLRLDIPAPTEPAELSDSDDPRPLGMGLYHLEVDVDGHCSVIDFLGRERYRMTARARKIYHDLQQVVSELKNPSPVADVQSPSRPRLAYISPLPPVLSGISDYSAELLPQLHRYYEVDVVVDQEQVCGEWILENCSVRDVQWFRANAAQFDRVLYHFGNSSFHTHMFDLLSDIPGVVVLHDFFLSNAICYLQYYLGYENFWNKSLYHSHGYNALIESYLADDFTDVMWKYPCNLGVVHDSLGVIAHSDYSCRLAEQWYGVGISKDWKKIPLLREPDHGDRETARRSLGLKKNEFVVCSFGMLGPTKLNDRLLDAWIESELSGDRQCRLIFVGENPDSEYGQKMQSAIRRYKGPSRIQITGRADKEQFSDYLAAADVGIQLRTLSRGETSAAVLDCMNNGLATVVNANGSMAELDPHRVWMLPDEFSRAHLVEALETLWKDAEKRKELGRLARKKLVVHHQPGKCAKQYHEAIEAFYRDESAGLAVQIRAVAADQEAASIDALKDAALCLAENFPETSRMKQLFVDVSAIVLQDLRSGIQRVVRSVLREWLLNPPEGWRVEPVYASVAHGYLYARRFTLEFLGCPGAAMRDEPIEFAAGDVFFGLDYHHLVQVKHEQFYRKLMKKGVSVHFLVYDLLPILLPKAFPANSKSQHVRWLKTITGFDGVVCISNAVANEVTQWVCENDPERCERFRADWFHLGADIGDSVPTKGMPAEAEGILKALNKRQTFLAVGTLEPRKGQTQILDAFELLWERGADVNLVLAGKQGWLVSDLIDRIRLHPQRNKKLFWLEAISDEFLGHVYTASDCLIAASLGEGFGLPLIEAAQHGIPILARDIPVFREVAGEYAFYFSGQKPADLASAVEKWLELYNAGTHPKSDEMPWLTWKQSARQLLGTVLTVDK